MIPGSHPYRSSAARAAQPSKERWWQRAMVLNLALVLAITAGAAWWAWNLGAEQRALRALPGAERQLLYQRTLANLRLCHARPADVSLKDFCENQVSLVLELPECGRECRDLSRLLWRATR